MCLILHSSVHLWPERLLFFFSKEREGALPLSEKACFKCVTLYPIIMPDKGNANTLCIKGAWNIEQPISWQLFSLISPRQPMGKCLQWWWPGRDSCLRFYTFHNPNTYFAFCSTKSNFLNSFTFLYLLGKYTILNDAILQLLLFNEVFFPFI